MEFFFILNTMNSTVLTQEFYLLIFPLFLIKCSPTPWFLNFLTSFSMLISNFLTNRVQWVFANGQMSTTLITNTGSLQNADHCPELPECIKWCKDNYLDLTVLKTKDMVIDFRLNTVHGVSVAHGEDVQVVDYILRLNWGFYTKKDEYSLQSISKICSKITGVFGRVSFGRIRW